MLTLDISISICQFQSQTLQGCLLIRYESKKIRRIILAIREMINHHYLKVRKNSMNHDKPQANSFNSNFLKQTTE